MHADGYAGFENLYRAGDIREVACMAHVRRKFVDVPGVWLQRMQPHRQRGRGPHSVMIFSRAAVLAKADR
jgi:hypothetical protein